MSRRRGNVTVALVALTVFIAGCVPAAGEDRTSHSSVFSDLLIEAEESGTASSAQIAALRLGVEDERIGIEAAREAARRALSCLQESGVKAEYAERSLSYGLLVPGYVVKHEPGEDVDTQIATCDEREFAWVNELYQVQPSSLEASERYVEQQAPVILACLRRNAVDVDSRASGSELARVASRAFSDSDGRTNCLAEAGVDAW
jgi:hypothetical protein